MTTSAVNAQAPLPQKAVIYCRVSSSHQTVRGGGIKSQETRCREFARYRRYEVVEIFTDDVSGGLIDRPGMQRMLAFLRKNIDDPHVVIIDDISRLARGLHAHMELRTAISGAGGILQSPSIEFGEDSDAQLVENMLASVSQHQRQKNAEQTKNRMRGRAMNGYWVFHAPHGYTYIAKSGQGKVLVPDQPLADIVTKALNGFASGLFQTQAEVKRYLDSQPLFPRDRYGEVRSQRVTDLLTNPLYAGFVHLPRWDIHMKPGKHQPLVSPETFDAIQKRLSAPAVAATRKDLNADFPLRGFVLCGSCSRPMTACFSKGKYKPYPYYWCHTPGCSERRKSIPRDKLEGAFETLLRQVQPTEQLYSLAQAMFRDAWDQRLQQAGAMAHSLKTKVAQLETQIARLLDRIVDAENPRVISTYEARIGELEKEKLILSSKLENTGQPTHTFEEMFEHAMSFLANPWKLWVSDRLEDKRIALRLTFSDRLAYCRNQGFRTPKISLPFKVLGSICGQKSNMAHRGGFEPPTPRFVVWCSIQLSYRCSAGRPLMDKAFLESKQDFRSCRSFFSTPENSRAAPCPAPERRHFHEVMPRASSRPGNRPCWWKVFLCPSAKLTFVLPGRRLMKSSTERF